MVRGGNTKWGWRGKFWYVGPGGLIGGISQGLEGLHFLLRSKRRSWGDACDKKGLN